MVYIMKVSLTTLSTQSRLQFALHVYGYDSDFVVQIYTSGENYSILKVAFNKFIDVSLRMLFMRSTSKFYSLSVCVSQKQKQTMRKNSEQ